MDTPKQQQQRRKRKQIFKSSFTSLISHFYSIWPLILCFCCFVFLLLDGFTSIGSSAFHPVLIVSRLPLLSTSSPTPMNSVFLPSAGDSEDDDDAGFLPVEVEDRVLFPDHVLLLFPYSINRFVHSSRKLYCIYHHRQSCNSTNSNGVAEESPDEISLPTLFVDEFDGYRSIARCPTPANYSASVFLQWRPIRDLERQEEEKAVGLVRNGIDQPVHSWERLVYAATLDGDTVVVFVKGLNLRPDRSSNPAQFVCHFGWGNLQSRPTYPVTSKALSAAQEVVRCSLPASIAKKIVEVHGIRVTVSGALERDRIPLPSVAKIFNFSSTTTQEKEETRTQPKKYELCVCTMVWNQASSLREWIIYHAWLGVERWFIYDNNSDDAIQQVIDELNQENHNVSRHVWPWLKTQEAGFSHCILMAKTECNWMGFMDVDEFFHFRVPRSRRMIRKLGYPGRDSLKSLVANFSSSPTIGEIRTTCFSFGPSGLSRTPSKGVMVSYTCRLRSPERHKSIVRPNAIADNLLNVVHHFQLKKEYRYLNLPQKKAVINHYKYQVWEAFRSKFSKRVATYVSNWQENQNEGSRDRVPGLGTEAIEPPNWALQFCEVWDTRLRDFVVANFAEPATTILPWERSLQ